MAFEARADGTTRVATLYQRAPCRVLFPAVEPGEPVEAVLLTTSGGLTAGDRTRVAVAVGADARVTVTTQAAEKIYRALSSAGEACVGVDLSVGERAWAEWLAQETILFNRARLRRTLTAEVDPGGHLLAVESVVFGRTAMNERFDEGLLHDAWRVRRNGTLIWADAVHLSGDIRARREEPFGFGTAVAYATVLYVGADASGRLAGAREILARLQLPAAATTFDGVLLVRMMGDDALRLKSAVMGLAAWIRHEAGGCARHVPRVWCC